MRQARNEKKKSAWGSGSVPGVCVLLRRLTLFSTSQQV